MKRSEIAEAYDQRVPTLVSLAHELEDMAKDAVSHLKHIDRVSFRSKTATSFLEKVFDRGKDYSDPLGDVEDQVGGRILVFFRSDIDLVKDAIVEIFNPIESVRKEPEEEDEFGYESHHLVLMVPPVIALPKHLLPTAFELQIRTLFMHAWAEPQHDLNYKSDSLSRDLRREFAWAAASAWGADVSFDRLHRALAKPNGT